MFVEVMQLLLFSCCYVVDFLFFDLCELFGNDILSLISCLHKLSHIFLYMILIDNVLCKTVVILLIR